MTETAITIQLKWMIEIKFRY